MAINKKKALIIIPTYNEGQNITGVIHGLRTVIAGSSFNWSVLVIDDASSDGTADIAEKLSGQMLPVFVLRRPKKSGIGSAYLAGFEKALEQDVDYIVSMDGDNSHRPEDLVQFFPEMGKTTEVIIGSRYIPGGRIRNWGRLRRLISRGANLLTGLLLGIGIKDATSGFRAYRSQTIKELDRASIKSDGYSFLVELIFHLKKNGSLIKEVPIEFVERVHGHSKLSRSEILKFFFTVWRLKLEQ